MYQSIQRSLQCFLFFNCSVKVFVDQYMASVEKQLLGTETVSAMRSLGIKSRICGISANDVSELFKESGANSFILKPMPTKSEVLVKELLRILNE